MSIESTIDLAQKLLGAERSELLEYAFDLDELASIDATYYCIPEKGGPSLIINDAGEVLYANSSVSFDEHVSAFKEGIRTPLEAFDRAGSEESN